MRFSLFSAILICIIFGCAGGAICMWLVQASLVTGFLFGGFYGLFFALLCAPRAVTPGAGLVWGLGYAFLLWLAIPAGVLPVAMGGMPAMGMLDTARAHFVELVAYALCFGAPLGLALGSWSSLVRIFERKQSGQIPAVEPRFSLSRALVVGGLAGILGGWAFGKWMAQVNFFPLIAGLVNSKSSMVGFTLHLIFAVIIGASFGVLFQRDVRGYGSSLGWGLVYGIFWWFLGPLTILPVWQGNSLNWSYQRGAALFGSLVGHIVYGPIVVCNSPLR